MLEALYVLYQLVHMLHHELSVYDLLGGKVMGSAMCVCQYFEVVVLVFANF